MGELDFDAIIESIYDASDDPAGFVPALRKVGALLGASGNHTLVIETATNAAENHAYGADEASFDEYNRHLAAAGSALRSRRRGRLRHA